MADTILTHSQDPASAPPFDGAGATTALVRGRRVVCFAGCNYLGLAQHPAVVEAARDALLRFGLSTSASRSTSGNTSLHESLEAALAAHLRQEAGLLTPDGYTANLVAAQALAAEHAVALLDERAHPSLRDAARVAGMEAHTFGHLDALDAAVQAERLGARGVVVMTDGVFAADGAIAPVPELLDALPRDRVRLLIDDCHGFCVLGDRGRGTPDHFGIADDRLVVTTTLAKGLGCAGGVVCAGRDLIAHARRTSSTYICTTPASPALTAGAMAAMNVFQDDPLRFERLRHNTNAVRAALIRSGLPAHDRPIPVFAIVPETRRHAESLRAAFDEVGVFVPLVSYPGGPSSEYFRLSVSSEHSADQVERLAEALAAGATSRQARPA